jgi:hypothetical protein
MEWLGVILTRGVFAFRRLRKIAKKRLLTLSCLSVCLSVCPHGTTWREIFVKFVYEYFSKICYSSSLYAFIA